MKLMQIAIAVDQLANTVAGGYADETMSARCWRLRRFYPYRALRPAIDVLFFWQVDHCRKSNEAELARTQSPREDQPSTTIFQSEDASMPLDKEAQKAALKEAIHEWLDDAFAQFGKWTLKGILAAAFCGAVYLALVSAGWHK